MTQPEEPSSDKSVNTPKWLKRIQENSWEAELLISGGAIFTLVQSSEFITDAGITFKENYPFVGLDEALLCITLAMAGLTIGFTLHLLLRGFWTALLCLNSVYPNGIQLNKLATSENFKAKTYSLSDHIVSVDNLCGLVFFGSIVFSLIVFGFLIHAGFTLLIAVALRGIEFLQWVVIGLFIIHYIDLLTGGILFRNKFTGKFYKPIYTFNNYINLGFIYLLPLQILATNINRLKLVAFMFVFFFASVFVSYESLRYILTLPDFFAAHQYEGTSNSEIYGDGIYLDRLYKRIRFAAVQSDIIRDSQLILFVPYRPAYDVGIKEAKAQSFAEIVKISINDMPTDSIHWYNYTLNKTNQRGIIAYLPIHKLAKGKNDVSVIIDDDFFKRRFSTFTIPFWKE